MEHAHSKKGMIGKWVALALLVLLGMVLTALLVGQIVGALMPAARV